MEKKTKRNNVRVVSAAGLTVVLGVLLWALIAYAALPALNFYTDGTYGTLKVNPVKYGRTIETIYVKMTNGLFSKTYYTDYYSPSTEGGTDLVPAYVKNGPLTSNGAGEVTNSRTTTDLDYSGDWQVRFLHNPNYSSPCNIVFDSPLYNGVYDTSASAVNVPVEFHLEDREGNTITTARYADLKVLFKDGATTIMRDNKVLPTPGASSNGKQCWWFDPVTYRYRYASSYNKNNPAGSLFGYDVVQGVNTALYFKVYGATAFTMAVAAEPDPAGGTDTFIMGPLTRETYVQVGTMTGTNPYKLEPAGSLNRHSFGEGDFSASSPSDYFLYFDMYDRNGTAITSGFAGTWTVSATGADDYDGTGQGVTTGSVLEPNTGENTTSHWMAKVTLPTPGKFNVLVRASLGNTPSFSHVVNYGASKKFILAGDVTGPANVTAYTATPSDNSITLGWTNPTTDEGGGPMTGVFAGVLVLRNTAPITDDLPNQGEQYDPAGVLGFSTIGTSRVMSVAPVASFTDGDPCTATIVVNGTTYYYRTFPFDEFYNYNSTGSEASATPFDTTPPAPVTGISVTEGNLQNLIYWTNSADCDYSGVTIRYKTNTWPTARDGSDGSVLAGTKNGGLPGSPNSFTHGSLTNGTPYFYTLWAKDNEGAINWSAGASPAAAATPHDVTAPSSITGDGSTTGLRVEPGSIGAFDVTLRWEATGDDGMTGNASQYEIRYANSPILDETDWEAAWHTVGANLPQPLPSGTSQTYLVAGLAPLTQYYFAIKVADEVLNWSGVSNSPAVTTLCNPEISGCNQCHLMPPDDDLPGAHPRGTGNIGAHYLPIHAGGGDASQCNVCHMDGQVWRNNTTLYKFTHQNDIIDLNAPGKIGNEAERLTSTGGTFFMETTIVYKYKNYSSGVSYKQMTGYCQNTYCHGAGLSSPRWGLDGIVCGEYCHETPPATGRHVKHYHPGQHYVNFAPTGTQVSGYTNDDGTGWSGTVTPVDRGRIRASGGNEDARYATFISSTNATETFLLPDGIWYVTACVGDSASGPGGGLAGQTVKVSGNGGSSWVTLIDNFQTLPEKLYKKVVDHEVIVSGGNDLMIQIGNSVNATALNFMIINATPEAPKANTTLLQNTPSEYGFACGKCHTMDQTQSKHTSHVDGAVQSGVRDAQIAFDGNSFPKNPFANYTQVAFYPLSSHMDGQGFNYTNNRSCVNTYCHGNTLNAGGSGTTPQWKDGYIDVEGASLCGACHDTGYADTTQFTAMSTWSHKKHVTADYAYRFDCYKCHNHTVGAQDPGDGNKIHITDKTYHVNGDVDAVFDLNDNSMAFGRYSTSIKTCYNVYCHSNGLLNQANEPYWATSYREPVWASGDKTCNYCHGTGRPDGMPYYDNLSTRPNSHVVHVDNNGLGCSKCHYNTTRDDGLTIYTTVQPTLHVNVTSNVSFDPENAGGSFNHGNRECSNTYCHGLTAPPVWGGVATCGSCHGVSATNPNPGVGAHNAHSNGNHTTIDSTGANRSGGGYYDFTCWTCHYSRTHGGGKYMPGTQTAEANFNTVDVVKGYNNTGAQYVTGSNVNLDPNNWEYTDGKCRSTKCHSNGRGGLGNNTSFTWTSPAGTLNCSGCHSGPKNITGKPQISTDNHSTHVWATIYEFDCGDCHALTSVGNNLAANGRAYHVDGQPDVSLNATWGGTYNGADMTCDSVKCHFNGNPTAWGGQTYYVQMNWTSVLGTSCTSCHSVVHNDAGDGARTGPQTLSHSHGKHVADYTARMSCTNCHRLTAATSSSLQATTPTHHNNGVKDVVFYTSFFNMTGLSTENPAEGYWGQYTPIEGGSATCTVICHSDGNGGNPARFPNWSSIEGSYGCGSCHGGKTTLTTGSHAKHLNGNIGCSACHRKTADGDAVTPFINASGFATKHVNGAKDVSMAFAFQLSGTSTYSAGVCNDTTCHGAGNSPIWGSGTTNCGSCHYSPPRYSQHFAHYSSTTLPTFIGSKNESTATMYRFACAKCHDPNGGSGSPINHAQGFVSADQAAEVCFDILSTPANGTGTYAAGALMGTDADGYKYTAGTCNNLYCHSNGRGTSVSIAWNVASVTCTSCHGGPAAKASVTLGGSHPQHVGTDTYTIGCMSCHDHVVSGNTTVSDKSMHVNAVKNVNFPTFGSMTGAYTGSNTCRNNYCHSDGNGGAAGTDVVWGNSATCITCHKYVAGANEITTGKHKEHINNAGDVDLASFECVDCHDMTVQNDNATIITSPNKHVNAAKDVYFKAFNGYTGAMTATKTCRNNYCHSSGQATPNFRTAAAWDGATTYGCAACHGADTDWVAVAGEPNYANVSTASKTTLNGHQKHVTDGASCFNCHANTVSAGSDILATGKHLDGFRNVSFTQGGTYNATTKRCSSTACHGTTSMLWGGHLPSDCQSCHSDMKAGTYANHSSTGKHAKHTDTATYKFACELCHAALNPATNTAHATGDVSANQAGEVVFHTATTVWRTKVYGNGGTAFRYREMDAALGSSGLNPGYAAGALAGSDPINVNRKWTNGTCSSVWCHSNGQTTLGYVNPTWNGAATTCTTCHGGKTTITSGKHAKHVNDGSFGNFGCAQCHDMTVNGDTSVNTYTNHVNGTRDVYFGAFNGYTGAITATKTCRNTYCHSSGQATPAFITAAAWDGATTYTCDSCHGAEGAVYVAGAPEYANVTTTGSNDNNSHYVTAHVAGTTDCFKCHANTVASDGTTILSTGRHINGFRNVSFTLGGTYTAATKTCTNTDAACHGASAMRWGGVADCETCHRVTTAEIDNFSYGDAQKATVNFAEYTAVGHGRPASKTYKYTGQSGAGLSCLSTSDSNTVGGCHRNATPHNATGNPFRLVSSATIKPTDPNSLCATACHTSPGVQNHVKSITGGTKYATWFFTPKCVDCHDPHGDNGGNDTTQRNYMMVQSFVNYSTGSNAYGAPYPAATYPKRAMDFPAETTRPASLSRASFVTAGFDGICQICHRRNSSVVFDRNQNQSHNGTTLCTDCHTSALAHNAGFQGAGSCTGCHGTGGSGTAAGRRNIETDFAQASHHIVASWATITPTDCARCHAEGNSDGSINSTNHTQAAGGTIDLNVYGTYPTVNGVINYMAFRNNSSLTMHCLGCHSDTNKAATPFSDGDTPNTYAWDYNAVGAKWSNTGTTPWGKISSANYNVVPADLVSKAYSPHGNATANERVVTVAETIGASGADAAATSNMACYDCHNSHGSTVTGGTSYTSGNTAGGIFIDRGGYKPASGGSAGTKNVYASDADLCFDCHMGDDGTAPKTYTTYGLASGQRVLGYYERVGTTWTSEDATRWSTADTWRGSFPYKDGVFKGGHFGNSRGYLQGGNPGTAVGGQCVKCHDPHGVAATVAYSKPVRTVGSTVGGPALSGTYSGPANESLVYVLQIVVGGAKGTATYRASANGGRTWAATTNTNTNYVNNGVTATWATATYAVNDTWTWQAGLDETFMVPALKGTWMHSPYKEDRAPRNNYTTDTTGGTARLTGITNANDYTTYNPALNTAIRLWDDSVGGTASGQSTRTVGAPGPRANPDFRTGSYVPGYNVVAVQGDGFGRGPAVQYGSGSTTYKGWNGYFIDENTFGTTILKGTGTSMTFNKMSTVVAATGRTGNFAGLCLQCHAWAKNSGVALVNVTSGNLGSGTARSQVKVHETVAGMTNITVDLFKRAINGGNDTEAGLYTMHQMTSPDSRTTVYSGPATPPGVSTADPGGGQNSLRKLYRWGVTGTQSTANTIQAQYHRFPCSKCHTPHVSRLPRLMKTNCLDNDNVGTAHTTMAFVTNGTSLPGTFGATLPGALMRNVACHSTKVGSQGSSNPPTTYYPGGWNNKTPW